MDLALADKQIKLVGGLPEGGRVIDVSSDSPPRFTIAGKLLHSRYDPMKEAEQQVGSIDSSKVVVCSGAGLGFAVRKFLEKGCNCIWFEPNGEVLRYALSLHDFMQNLVAGSLRIFTAAPGESYLADMFRGRSINDVRFFSHRNFTFEEHQAFEQRLVFFLGKKNVNIATLSRFDRLWARNFTRNIVHLRRAKPVRLLFGAERGKVAVLASAGPSLNDSIHDLKKIRDRVVLIAVDTAVRILTAAGIDPDYILSVDPQPVNRVYLEDYEGQARIVVDPTVSPGALKGLQNLYFFWSPFRLAQIFFDLWDGSPGEIAFGGSVSTNAYDFARKLGCDPVYLIGQDLAFSDGQVHAKGAILEERLNWKESRVFRREAHNRMQRAALPVLLLPGLNGRAVETNEKLLIFYRWFERRFERDLSLGLRVENATRRGAAFKQLRLASLTVESEPVTRSLDPEFKAPDANRVLEQIETFLAELGQVKGILREGLDIVSRAAEGKSQGQTARLSDVDERLREHGAILDCLGLAAQKAILGITEGNSNVNGLENTAQLYQALYQGAHDYENWFRKSLKAMTQFGAEQESTAGSKT
ncbi:MAG: DUF115 domain-containing protein [Spirochaetia bacterium]|nr:DUF115 domain-containing protein [Spirochaetia bacterium]